jgi:hypothetical protein
MLQRRFLFLSRLQKLSEQQEDEHALTEDYKLVEL